VNTWGGFEQGDNAETCFFSRILREVDPACAVDVGYDRSKDYDLVISLYRPIPGSKSYADMTTVETKSICFTGESYDLIRTTPGCDAYIGFDLESDVQETLSYLRFPLYAAYHLDNLHRYGCSTFEELRNKFSATKIAKISAVVSNPSNGLRSSLLGYLTSSGACISGGAVHNNAGRVDDKMKFTSEYAVGMAFENLSKKSYITEKIYEVLAVNSIPFYWGASDIGDEFNPKSYLQFDATNQDTANRSIQSLYSLLTDPALLAKMAEVDPITGFRSEKYIKDGKNILKNFIMNLVESK
jgi:hypothetical protein